MPEVVLTTAYREHALQAYEYGVLDYLLKPISFMRFAKAVERYKEKHSDDIMSRPVIFKSGFEYHKVAPKDIVYIQSAKEYVYIICTGNRYLVRSTMGDILKQLPYDHFLQVHKSYIVPVLAIRSVAATDVILNNGDKIPLGRSFAKQVRAKFSGG